MKKISLIALSLFFLQGCVTITSEVDGDEAIGYEDGVPVSSDHKLFHAVTVGQAIGFSGTSIFPITGNVSPDMSNEGVEFALAETLRNAGMLSASDNDAQYVLNADFVWNNEEGAWGHDGPLMIDMVRETKINYVLK